MISRVVNYAAKNPVLVLAVTVAACSVGWWSLTKVPLDAIPDLGETQVIIYSKWDRSPDIVEDQVTYPIVSAMLGSPRVKTVRGISDFGYSYVYVIFEDGTDLYWARSRTLEYLSVVLPGLPVGVKTELGPDATGLGWVYQYALVDTSSRMSLADLRSYQDWNLRYQLKSVPGVAEVAPVGGFTRQFQVNVDPNRLRAYGLSLGQVVDAVRAGNVETGARLLEFGETEYMVRGRGYARTLDDFRNIMLPSSEPGSPVRVQDVGEVTFGPDLRRGVAELGGNGEVVSGIVLMRSGGNALDVTDRVKAKIQEIERGLPDGVKITPVYDRSELIRRAIWSVRETILEIVLTVVLIILLFLWHFPSASIPIVTIPVAVLLSFIPFRMLGMTANIMSLAGVAIAVGELVDASIVVVEQTHKKLEIWQRDGCKGDARQVVLGAIQEVAGPTFYALLVIAISFLPILALEGEEGKMFKPLAYSKSLSMVVAALLAITLDPALRLLLSKWKVVSFRPAWLCGITNRFMSGRIRPEHEHPVSRRLIALYEPVVRWTLRWRWAVVVAAAVAIAATVPVFMSLGSEFMPPLDEGVILYMPSTPPGISVGEARRLLQTTDRVIASFPEVQSVLGKAGRAETATDPAPLSMLETVVVLKPREQWPRMQVWYSAWAPEWTKRILRHFTHDTISSEELIRRMDAALKIPGVVNAWTMPIKGRIDMLSTGIRTPVGLKITGPDLAGIEAIGTQVESVLRTANGTRSVFAERTGGGYFLDVQWDREQLAHNGLSMEDAQRVLENGVGGENVTTAVVGRERYPVNVRFMRDYRSDIASLGQLPVSSGGARQIPLSQLASLSRVSGPAMIRNENGLLTGYVYVDIVETDPASYVSEADRLIRNSVKVPTGYALSWSGQYEAMQRVKQRLMWVIPLTLGIILFLLYLNTRSLTKVMVVLLAVPFSAVGAIWLIYFAGYNLSIAVWVGLIALLGVDAETGVFMLLYLELARDEAMRVGRLSTLQDLREAIVHGAAKRLRPKFMTFATTCLGLLPILWATGTGSDVMKRIAAPMIGGIFTSFVLELLVYPAIYEIWRKHSLQQSNLS